MPAIDPSGFMLSGRIITASGGTFELWMDGASSNGGSIFHNREVAFRDLTILQSVEIELDEGFNGKLNIAIGAPYDLGLELLRSDLFMVGNRIEVQIGYPRIGLMTPWFGATNAKPSIAISPDAGLTATLNGEGGAFAATRSAEGGDFGNGSYLDVIQHIAARTYNDWDVDAPDQSGEDDPLYANRTLISQGQRSEWAFIHQLCRQAECDLYVRPSDNGRTVLVIRRRRDTMGAEPEVLLVCREQVDFINRFPIISFETDSPLVWLPRGFNGVRTNDIDRDTGDESPASATQESRARDGITRTGDGNVVSGGQQIDDSTVALQPDDDGVFVPTSSGDPSRTQTEVVNQETDEAAEAGTFVASVTTIGMPNLYPESVVRIEGIGMFSGNYIVSGITHSVGESFETTLSLRANAPIGDTTVSSLLLRPWSDSDVSVNTQSPQEVQESTGSSAMTVEPEVEEDWQTRNNRRIWGNQ
jgi:hypothetical protein